MNNTKKSFPDLEECNELLENIVDNMPLGIAIISPKLFLLKANPVFSTLFHLSDMEYPIHLKDVSGNFWNENDTLMYLSRHYQEQEYQFENEFTWNDEGNFTRTIKIHSRSLGNETHSRHKILLTFSDITEQKENEKGRNEHVRHLMHELRNPLSNISLCMELLTDSTQENNQTDTNLFLSKASASVQRMKQLINDLNQVRKS